MFDATGQVVGRMAAHIAPYLTGKYQPTWTHSHDSGDTVVVVNAEKIEFTGRKWQDKLYRKHSGYPGGLKELTARQVLERDPGRVLSLAVKGMLPNDKLRRQRLSRLKIYEGTEHPHSAQFKMDVRKTTASTEVVVPVLPKVHQDMLDFWRAQGDKGLRFGMGDEKIIFAADAEKKN